jgi:hypothetical protein
MPRRGFFFFSFVAHATTTSGIAHVLLFFRRAPVLAAGVRRGDDEDIRYLRVLTSATARQRVIPGRGNSNNLRAEAGQQRFAVWKRTFQCHHGTEEKGPGRWWDERKSPGTGRGEVNTAAPEGMYNVLDDSHSAASRCRRKLGKRWPGQMESDSTWRDISSVLRNRSRKRLGKHFFFCPEERSWNKCSRLFF